MPDTNVCPCGSNKAFSQCCGPRISGEQPAETAEQLMRSRYSAYTRGDEAYLLQSWHPSTRPAQLDLAAGSPQWIGLKVVGHEAGQRDDDTGTVTFIARYKINGKAHRMQEKSRFQKEAGRWLYVDGEVGE